MYNIETLSNFLINIFPNKNIIFEGEGWTSFAFTVGNNIVRFPKYSLSSYEKEVKVLQFLKNKISFKIPETQIIYNVKFPFVMHKKLIGNKWNIDTYNNLSKYYKDAFCEDIARFFYEIHNINLTEIRTFINDKTIEKPQQLSFEEVFIFLKNDLSIKEIENAYKYYINIYKPTDDLVLIHNDFYEQNSLINKKHRLTVVFDFCNINIDERCLDFRGLISYEYLFKKVIQKYREITGIDINTDRIKQLDNIDSFNCLNYLQTSNLKNKMKKEWNENILKIKSNLI